MKMREVFAKSSAFLMEGALAERLKREYHLEEDKYIAWAAMVMKPQGQLALKELWTQYRSIAHQYGLPFLATTPTRRVNQERVERYGDASIIEKNVEFLRCLQEETKELMFVGGLMGCKNDAYRSDQGLSQKEAYLFHLWQALEFANANVDFLYAGIMPCLPEALGMAQAMAETNLPYIISFTLQGDGKLLDGTTLDEAIHQIDTQTKQAPLCYMSNCVHPNIVLQGLLQPWNQSERVKQRFMGIQANTSSLSLKELDSASFLKSCDPNMLARDMMKLKQVVDMKIFGGCCGTNQHHMEEIAKRLAMQINSQKTIK